MTKPHIVIIGTGGTIVSSGASGAQMTGYSIQGLDVRSIISAVPALAEIANIDALPLLNIGSSNIKLSDWLKLTCTINKLAEDPKIHGFVITHGTDTMEETAFFLNLTLKTEKPVVFTGSMRPATAISADGPLNLLNAVRLASSKQAWNKGVLVSLNGQIHGARDVSKTNTVSVETFCSPTSGPLGYIIGEDIDFLTQSVKPHTLSSEFHISESFKAEDFPRVEIILSHADEDGHQLERCLASKPDGIILELTGNSTVPAVVEKVLKDSEHQPAVVRASRTGSGPVTKGKAEWQEMQMIPGGTLSAQKCRILLQLALHRFGRNQKLLEKIFQTY